MPQPGLNAEFLKRQAQAHFQSQRLNEARALFSEACQLDQSDAQAWHMLGVTCAMLGDLAEAERCCRKTIELKPDVAVAHANLANVLVSLGRLDEAESLFLQALKLKPGDAQTHTLLGNLRVRLGRPTDAETNYREAVRYDPGSAEAHNNLGVLLWEQGRHEEAVASLRRAIALKPDYTDAYSNLGNALKDQLKNEEAETYYRRALQLNPTRVMTLAGLGKVLQVQGKLKEAQECYRKALDLAPDLAEAHFNLGYLHREEGRLEEALAHFDRALAIKPDYTQARLGQAVTLQELGRMEEAVTVFRSILGIKPNYESTIELPEVPPTAPTDNGDASVITVATSIAPRNIENQQQAVESWRQHGFNVVSVNSPDEIAVVKEHFPEVEFVVATRDARREFGKPYVYFDDLLEYLGKHGTAVCGIINSDIHLRTNLHFKDFLLGEAIDSFVFGCRMDVSSLESLKGKPFTYGYDFFFFDRKFTAIYPKEIFCMGLPWVDYWAVLIPALRNLPVKKLMTPVAYHITHTLNWNEDLRKSLNRAIVRYIGAEQPPSERFVSVYSHYVHALIESRSKEVFLPDR